QKALLIDTGVVGERNGSADVTRAQVAEAGGTPLADLLKNPTREVAAPLMARGAARIVGELVESGRADGIVSLGGTQGTTLATSVMRQLPYGFPKVMVSTMASGDVSQDGVVLSAGMRPTANSAGRRARSPGGERLGFKARSPEVRLPGSVATPPCRPPDRRPAPSNGLEDMHLRPLITDVRLTGEEQVA